MEVCRFTRRQDLGTLTASPGFFIVWKGSSRYDLHMLTNPAILERVIDPERGDFPIDFARQVLKFAFPPKDRARYEALSYKAQDGELSAAEKAELEDYLNVNDLLMILKAKAESSLREQNPAA